MTHKDWLALVTLSLLWGGSFPLIEVGLIGFLPLTLVFVRVAVSALALGGYLLLRRGWLFRREAALPLLVMGFLNGALPFGLLTTAQGQISGGLASVLNATTPLFTMVVAHVLTPDDKITRAKSLGLGLGVVGVLVMMSGAPLQGDARAMALCLGAALSYGLAIVWGRRLSRRGIEPQTIAFGQVFGATLLLVPLVLITERPWAMAPPPIEAWVAVTVLALFSTVIALVIYFWLLGRVGPTRTSVVTFLVPITATALGALFLHERMALHHWAGFALILMGLAAINRRRA